MSPVAAPPGAVDPTVDPGALPLEVEDYLTYLMVEKGRSANTLAAYRRDLRRYAGDAMRGKHDLARATAALPSFEKPVLVVWDEEGKMMPNDAGRALADSFPNSRYVELSDCFTLIPEDQPEALAGEIRRFAA